MKSKILTTVGCLAFVGYLLYLTLSPNSVRCEVCMEFNGRTACRTASGANEDEARRTATQSACAEVAPGMTDGIRCMDTEPKSVRVL